MNPLRLRPFLPLLLLGACAAPSAPLLPRAPEPAVELADVRALLWQGREDEALEWLEGMAWRHSGSVAAERLRQDLRVARGERAELAAELEDLAEQGPDPDLTYLRARLHGDPERRLDALEEGARRHPTHPWLALGAAATRQEFGDWQEAEEWLDGAPAEPASASFRRLLIARQQSNAGRHFSAWRTLERDAFESGSREALTECIRIAQALDSDRRLARAQTEFALRSAPAAGDVGAAMDRVLERLIAEEPWMREADLAQTLAQMDVWAELAGVPTGWSAQPRYTVAGIAELVQPESFRGGAAAAWMQHGRFLLIGRAPGRGVDWVLLQDARCVELPEEGGLPVEMIVARRGLEPADRTIPGGAPFHGFFLRLDLVEAGASLRSAELARFAAGGPADRAGAPSGGGQAPAPELRAPAADPLESWDLALRLRARRLAAGGASIRDLELVQLLTHEVSHLPETLPWARGGVPILGLAPFVLRSMRKFGDPILFLEERAQLRALAAGVETEWAFAELLDRAMTPRDPYYAPYRSLLLAMVEEARAAGWPELAAWDRLPPGAIADLAQRLLQRRRIAGTPRDLLAAALRGLDRSQTFDQLPVEHLAQALSDQR